MNQTHPSIDHIVDYLHGELSAAEDAAMHAHLASCRSCDRIRADEVALTETLRGHARAQERELPPGLVAKIREAATRPQPAGLLDSLRALLRPAFFLPVAAAVAVIAYFGFTARHAAPVVTAIDPSYYVENHAAMAASEPFAQESTPVVLTSNDETH
ncbi:MAG: anti-sigma factor [Candidatus Cybelea sp.]